MNVVAFIVAAAVLLTIGAAAYAIDRRATRDEEQR